MPEHLEPADAPNERDALRLLSRSPHPYHRQKFELLHPSDTFASVPLPLPLPFLSTSRETTASSDSGTEADDEHFLKGLPAPRRLHKGLRGRNEVLSGTSTPIPSPALLEEEGRKLSYTSKKDIPLAKELRSPAERLRRRKEVVRRLTELLIVAFLGVLVYTNPHVQPVLQSWNREFFIGVGVPAILAFLYPLRLTLWAYYHRATSRKIPISVPSTFDPAPLLYPPAITLFVSSLVAVEDDAVLLPNIVLAICSLPPTLIPTTHPVGQGCNPLHWALSCMPLVFCRAGKRTYSGETGPSPVTVSPETATLLYPLHQNLCILLHVLTSTSLLTAELQLLSISLINLLLLSSSPQAIILKSMLWVGGLDILVTCSQAIMSGISLARVPKWRFKRPVGPSKRGSSLFSAVVPWRRVRHDLFHTFPDSSSCSSCEALDDPEDSDAPESTTSRVPLRVKTATFDGADSAGIEQTRASITNPQRNLPFSTTNSKFSPTPLRRYTLPSTRKSACRSHTRTPSGRRKRSASTSVRAFFALTQQQAAVRKWIYAVYVYACIAGAIFLPLPWIGIKGLIMDEALHGHEPVGWALGYLFGDSSWFRWEVVSHNLERWICLPARPTSETGQFHYTGWADGLRRAYFGEANTRLLWSAYCVAVIVIGLIVVSRLSPMYEVDTRRKVFHFMMVAMFLPTTYIDPTFAALAFSVVLALFLLLDLLRASQLPPLSKPLAFFLAPYVDGRDLRGPVVISHIFLLIGCAIPLWLSLGSLPRTGAGYLEGWDVPTREVSMVSGVVCVGLGD
ncbi:hypothetical protein F4779DRAFT_610695, partial [Xylariaceae sp. FL0662B]